MPRRGPVTLGHFRKGLEGEIRVLEKRQKVLVIQLFPFYSLRMLIVPNKFGYRKVEVLMFLIQ